MMSKKISSALVILVVFGLTLIVSACGNNNSKNADLGAMEQNVQDDSALDQVYRDRDAALNSSGTVTPTDTASGTTL